MPCSEFKPPLYTSRLVLRDFVQSDVSKIVEIVSHPQFSGYSRFRPDHILDDVGQYINGAIDFQNPDPVTGYREIFRLAICLKQDPTHVIGCCVFHGWNKLSEEKDQIGYFIHPENQGEGYAFEATQCLIETYFFHYPERNVYAVTHPLNLPSHRVWEKIGFSKAGEGSIDVYGIEEPRLIYCLDRQGLKNIIG